MNVKQILDKVNHIHDSIAADVYPDGWSGTCHTCGKPFHYTREECAYYLRHGWPRCDHNYSPTDSIEMGKD